MGDKNEQSDVSGRRELKSKKRGKQDHTKRYGGGSRGMMRSPVGTWGAKGGT